MSPMRQLNRRQFIGRTLTAASFFTLASGVSLPAAAFHGRIRKAMIVDEVTEKTLEPLHAAGFNGVETRHICSEDEAAKGRAVAEKLGMRVHSLLRGCRGFTGDHTQGDARCQGLWSR